MAVDAALGRVGEVRSELDEEGPEVVVEAVEVEVVDHGGVGHQPGVGLPGDRVVPTLGAKDVGLFLGPADEEDPLGAIVASEVLVRDVVLALTLLEMHQVEAVGVDELVDRADERIGDRRHEGRGDKRLALVGPEEMGDPVGEGQLGLVEVEIHPIDALETPEPIAASWPTIAALHISDLSAR